VEFTERNALVKKIIYSYSNSLNVIKEVTINLKMQRTIYLALKDLINMEEEN